MFAAAAGAACVVKGLVWRSHLDDFAFSAAGEPASRRGDRGGRRRVPAATCGSGRAARTTRSSSCCATRADRSWTSRSSAASTCATAGATTRAPRRPAAAADGRRCTAPRPPWHDIQVAVRGPAVGDVETVFRERWEDPSRADPQPVPTASPTCCRRDDDRPGALPPPAARPAARGPPRRPAAAHLPAAPARLPVRAGRRAQRRPRPTPRSLGRARRLDLPGGPVPVVRDGGRGCFASRAARATPTCASSPSSRATPTRTGGCPAPPNLVGRRQALRRMHARPAATGSPSTAWRTTPARPSTCTPRSCVVDDVWASVGSDNINRRSWTHDSELGAAVLDEALDGREPADPGDEGMGPGAYARQLRLRSPASTRASTCDTDDLLDPRPPSTPSRHRRLPWRHGTAPVAGGSAHPVACARFREPDLGPWTRVWATGLYRLLYDPDGRTRSARREGRF